MKDYYQILGISSTATASEIRTAYKKKALMFHPDKNKESGAEDAFKEISEAHDILNDPQARAQYDWHYQQTPQEDSTNQFQFDPQKSIEQIFGEYLGVFANFFSIYCPINNPRSPGTILTLQRFVEQGLDVNIEFIGLNGQEFSLLKLGIIANNAEFIKFLLLKGAKIEQMPADNQGNVFPFVLALERCQDSDIASLLITNETPITQPMLDLARLKNKAIFLATMLQEIERRDGQFQTNKRSAAELEEDEEDSFVGIINQATDFVSSKTQKTDHNSNSGTNRANLNASTQEETELKPIRELDKLEARLTDQIVYQTIAEQDQEAAEKKLKSLALTQDENSIRAEETREALVDLQYSNNKNEDEKTIVINEPQGIAQFYHFFEQLLKSTHDLLTQALNELVITDKSGLGVYHSFSSDTGLTKPSIDYFYGSCAPIDD